MDMEKIIIWYLAETLQYEFPKRKWHQWNLENRIASMQLKSLQKDKLDLDILLQVYEKWPDMEQEESESVVLCEWGEMAAYYIYPAYKKEIYSALFENFQKEICEQEHLIIWDECGEILPEMVYAMAENRNYFSVLTKCPNQYETVFQRIEMDYGLVPMLFEEEKELSRYLKSLPVKNEACLIVEKKKAEKNEDTSSFKQVGGKKSSLLYSLPKGSMVVELGEEEIYRMRILQKRMSLKYASIPIFLDNIVKNRYNAVVNEGITFQVKNKKKQLLWRRKG